MTILETRPNLLPLKVLREALLRSGFRRQQQVISSISSNTRTTSANPPPTLAMMIIASNVKRVGVSGGGVVGVVTASLQVTVESEES